MYNSGHLVLKAARLYSSQVTEWSCSDEFGNPLRDLDPFLQTPIFRNDEVYTPEKSVVKAAQDLFSDKHGKHHLKQLPSVVNFDHLPEHNLPEVAFAGASNVGKSSLITALFFNTPAFKIAVSKKPGRTRRLHFFDVRQRFSLVDMPGYGENMPPHYITSVETYLQSRPELCRIFLLLDGKYGITDVDSIGIEMMEEFQKPYALVLTKIDAASHHEVLRSLMKIKKQREANMPGCFPQPFLVSAHQGAGLAQLRAFIAHVTGALD